MANSGGVITKPVRLKEDIYTVLGINPTSLGEFTLSYASCNIHGKINRYSKKKPIRHDSKSPITDEENKASNFGLEVTTCTTSSTSVLGFFGWNYLAPASFSVKRMQDFAGYNHNAKIFCKPIDDSFNNILVWNTATDTSCPYIYPAYKYGNASGQQQGDITGAELLLGDFSDPKNSLVQIGKYHVSVICFIDNGIYVATSYGNIERSLSSPQGGNGCWIDMSQFSIINKIVKDKAYTLYPVINPIYNTTWGGVYQNSSTILVGDNGRQSPYYINYPESKPIKFIKTNVNSLSYEKESPLVINNIIGSSSYTYSLYVLDTSSMSPSSPSCPRIPSTNFPTDSNYQYSKAFITITVNISNSEVIKTIDDITIKIPSIGKTLYKSSFKIKSSFTEYNTQFYDCIKMTVYGDSATEIDKINIEKDGSVRLNLTFEYPRAFFKGSAIGPSYGWYTFSYTLSYNDTMSDNTPGNKSIPFRIS